MKKLINRILACMLTMAMVIGTFAGAGTLVANAAVGDTDLYVTVCDQSQKPVEGISLVLENKNNAEDILEIPDETDNWGDTEYDSMDITGEGTYLLKPAEDSGYVAVETVEIHYGWNSVGYGSPYIDTVNGEAYDPDEGIILTVKPEGSSEISESSINEISVTPQEISRDGQEVTVTVKGENLPATLYYKRSYKWTAGSSSAVEKVDAAAQEITGLTGSETERIFNVDLTNTILGYDKNLAEEYYIEVATSADGTYSKAVLQLESLPEITDVSVAQDTTIGKEGGTITVTVKGQKLPDELYYKRNYKWGNELANGTAVTVGPVAATGTSEEKTIEVELPAVEGVYANARQWTITVGSFSLGYKPTTPIIIPIDGIEASPEITSVTVSPEIVSAEGEDEVTVTVNGTTLPDTAKYKIMYLYRNGEGTKAGSTGTKDVSLTGESNTSKTFTVNLPKKSEVEETYPIDEVIGWRIDVGIGGMYGTFISSNDIAIEGVEEPEEPTFDGKTLKVKVVDKDENAVSGLTLQMKSTDTYMDLPVIDMGTTDENGTVSYTCQNNEDTYAPYKVLLKSDSEYEFADDAMMVEFSYESGSYSKTIIDKVNSKKYDGAESVIKVQEKAPEATIGSVMTETKSVDKAGETIVVKVAGENLPDKLYYQLGYKWADDDGTLVEGRYELQEPVIASGSSTEKEISISLPSAEGTNRRVWRIKVGATADGIFKQMSSDIIIKGFEETSEPEINSVSYSLTEAKREGEPVTVTVKGAALPEKLYYAIVYKKANGEEKYVKEDVIENAEGTDSERSFTVDIPAVSEYPEAVAWRIGVNMIPNDGYYFQKDGFADKDIPVAKDVVTEETEKALNEAIEKATEESEALNKEDYTEESWNAYIAAIEAAKALVGKEDATNEECKNAIKAIDEAKAALEAVKEDIKEVKVTKISISGLSKKIAAGKKIQLTAKVSPSNATEKDVVWTTSNKKYATVSKTGVVTLKKASAGKTVTITATAKDGSGKSATYKIKSMKGVVKKVSVSGNKSVKAGKTLKLTAKVTASKGANKTLKWTSSNTKYAKVTSSGKVKTYKAGKGKKVKITAMATDGSGKKKTVTIKIK
ncbi:MAG: Ig-like domain-containing protein [Lachnospiraceae bacterium]